MTSTMYNYNPPSVVPIQKRAMLIEINVSKFQKSKKDKKATRQLADINHTKEGRVRANKDLLADKALDEITTIESRARAYLYSVTLPWSNEGPRILAATKYWEVIEKLTEFKDQFNQAVAAFCERYPDLVEQAIYELNGLFNEDDYPDPRYIRGKFAFGISRYQIPEAEDFRIDLGAAENERIRQDMNERLNSVQEQARKDIFKRLQKPVKHMIERLRIYSKQNTFRDTLVENVREIVTEVRALNEVLADYEITDLCNEMERELCSDSAGELRASNIAREEKIEKAESCYAEITRRMGQYM